LVYLLSSGPVLATAFWLADATGWQGFYLALWLYAPLLLLQHVDPLMTYIDWWVDLFGAVGPV
jgi:hypothetical protein